jgi:hypothetical protein
LMKTGLGVGVGGSYRIKLCFFHCGSPYRVTDSLRTTSVQILSPSILVDCYDF